MKNKIKHIYCLGSSFTAGGGFEFDSEFRIIVDKKRYDLYKSLNEEMTLYNFSWPGQLQKLIGDNVKVHNIAKQGYGNDRTERLLYDIVNDFDFKKDETLFLIELTALGRDEWFCNEFDDYIICNYMVKNDKEFEFGGIAKDYFYQSIEEQKKLDKHNEFFKKIVTEFKNVKNEADRLDRNINFFISYLEHNKINYLLSSPPPDTLQYYDKSKRILFGDGLYFKNSFSFVEFFHENKLSITHETYGTQVDGHGGFKSNKLSANIIYNELVKKNLINLPKKEIDWKYFHQLEIIKKDSILI
jgi:hypothetical protein